MKIEWYGHAAFKLTAGETAVVIDPFGDVGQGRSELQFDYPAVDTAANLVLVTHQHFDHNASDRISGNPQVLAQAGTFQETPVGTVTGINSDHDNRAGTQRGRNVIFCFELDGWRICHFGDFGQASLRPEQAAAIGQPDLLFVPAGGGPTTSGKQAAAIARQLDARFAIPMHYRTGAINFLEPVDAFVDQFNDQHLRRCDGPVADTADLEAGSLTTAVILQAPGQ